MCKSFRSSMRVRKQNDRSSSTHQRTSYPAIWKNCDHHQDFTHDSPKYDQHLPKIGKVGSSGNSSQDELLEMESDEETPNVQTSRIHDLFDQQKVSLSQMDGYQSSAVMAGSIVGLATRLAAGDGDRDEDMEGGEGGEKRDEKEGREGAE